MGIRLQELKPGDDELQETEILKNRANLIAVNVLFETARAGRAEEFFAFTLNRLKRLALYAVWGSNKVDR